MYEGGWWFLTGLVYVNEMGKPLIIFFFTARLPEIYGIWSFACLGFDWVIPREMLDLLFDVHTGEEGDWIWVVNII